jgi:hypothetical protein
MLDDEDYSVGSNFAKFIMKTVGRNPATAEAQLCFLTCPVSVKVTSVPIRNAMLALSLFRYNPPLLARLVCMVGACATLETRHSIALETVHNRSSRLVVDDIRTIRHRAVVIIGVCQDKSRQAMLLKLFLGV